MPKVLHYSNLTLYAVRIPNAQGDDYQVNCLEVQMIQAYSYLSMDHAERLW